MPHRAVALAPRRHRVGVERVVLAFHHSTLALKAMRVRMCMLARFRVLGGMNAAQTLRLLR